MNIPQQTTLAEQARQSAESWTPAWVAWHHLVARHYPLGLGIEVGVAYGGHLAFLREQLPEATLVGVDPYRPYAVAGDAMDRTPEDFDALYAFTLDRLQRATVLLVRDTSISIANRLARCQATTPNWIAPTWVFLDGAHDYESIRADIAAWGPLCKHLGGHDYGTGWPGVMQAVNEERERRGCELEVELASGVWHLKPKGWAP